MGKHVLSPGFKSQYHAHRHTGTHTHTLIKSDELLKNAHRLIHTETLYYLCSVQSSSQFRPAKVDVKQLTSALLADVV